MRAVLDDTRLQLVVQLEAASQQSAIEGWPHDFAAWVQPLWTQLKASADGRTVKQTGGSRAD